jgi:hypothetical protein
MGVEDEDFFTAKTQRSQRGAEEEMMRWVWKCRSSLAILCCLCVFAVQTNSGSEVEILEEGFDLGVVERFG